MTEVARGQNEANKTFAPELFFTLFFNHFSCGRETYIICTIEDEEHFGEVGLRLTPRSRREMRLTTGWPKSNVPKVRAYCSASDHLIRKIFQGCVGIFTGSRNI